MIVYKTLGALGLAAFGACAVAADTEPTTASAGPSGDVRSITPIFSQLLLAPFPTGFVTVFEKPTPTQYIRESVRQGETDTQWTQMITVTGVKDLALNPNVTPQKFLESIAGGFQKACPESFKAVRVAGDKLDGHEAFIAIASCGVSPSTGGRQSETALIEVIKGDKDYYTIQWAERAAPSNVPMELDRAKWTERFRMLAQVKLCAVVPGEAPPYPSCVDRK